MKNDHIILKILPLWNQLLNYNNNQYNKKNLYVLPPSPITISSDTILSSDTTLFNLKMMEEGRLNKLEKNTLFKFN